MVKKEEKIPQKVMSLKEVIRLATKVESWELTEKYGHALEGQLDGSYISGYEEGRKYIGRLEKAVFFLSWSRVDRYAVACVDRYSLVLQIDNVEVSKNEQSDFNQERDIDLKKLFNHVHNNTD